VRFRLLSVHIPPKRNATTSMLHSEHLSLDENGRAGKKAPHSDSVGLSATHVCNGDGRKIDWRDNLETFGPNIYDVPPACCRVLGSIK
jgi:hypothetical protein